MCIGEKSWFTVRAEETLIIMNLGWAKLGFFVVV